VYLRKSTCVRVRSLHTGVVTSFAMCVMYLLFGGAAGAKANLFQNGKFLPIRFLVHIQRHGLVVQL
jgi:hypothetical protein